MDQDVKSQEFDVLLEIEGSRRVLRVSKETAMLTIEKELGKLDKDIFLLPLGSQHQQVCVLQRWCSKFHTYVDVTNQDEFEDGLRLTVTNTSTSTASKSPVQTNKVYVMIIVDG